MFEVFALPPAPLHVPAHIEAPLRVAAAGDFVTRSGPPSIGMGLNGISDWSTEHPFLDLMKSARPWVGHLPGQLGGWEHADLERAGALDADGWPRRIPRELAGISTLILTDQPEAGRSLAGRYLLRYRGTGEIEVDGRVSRVGRRPGEIRFDYTPGPGSVIVTIKATDPGARGDHIRDIRITAERDTAHADAGGPFNARWLARVGGIRAARFMDWMDTNNSTQTDWADRPKPGDYTYARAGVPVEVMVALANRLGADPWFNMPHRASDAYVAAFASYVRDHLDPRRRAHVEYSNEIWNWQFDQAAFARDQARRRWGRRAGDDAYMQYAGVRAAEVAEIWREVFGAGSDRLVRVIATQTDWPGLETPLLEAPLHVGGGGDSPPAASFDAYAVTGYFGGALGGDKAPMVRRWLAGGEAAALTKALRELDDGRLSGDPSDSIQRLTGELWPYHARVARAHGLDLVMYEGGTHVVGQGDATEDAALTAFFATLNYSVGMGALYARLLEGWRAAGGTLFTAFVDVAGPSRWGSWGALRHLDDDTPRWQALRNFNADNPAWWDSRPASDFTPR